MCEPKGKDAFPVENHVHLIIASNNSWVVPAGFEERRFMVLDVSDKYLGNTQYFAALFNQLNNGGREAMIYDLLEYDYSAVNLRVIPRTKALFDQIMHTASPLKKFWYGCLYEGKLLDNQWSNQVLTQRLYDAYIEFTKQINQHAYRLDVRQFGKDLRDMCIGIDKRRPTINGVRTYALHIPSLDACRRAFEQLVGMTANEMEWLNDTVDTQVDDDDIFASWGRELDTSLEE